MSINLEIDLHQSINFFYFKLGKYGSHVEFSFYFMKINYNEKVIRMNIFLNINLIVWILFFLKNYLFKEELCDYP
jgi:hypothetical protein